MNAHTPLPSDVQKKADNRRKRKALLAGGVVLGIGAAVTLAAWSDDVFADGTFNTGSFELQGAVDAAGSAFENYDGPAGDADNVGSLTFNQDPTALTPDVQVFAPISLRLAEDTNVAAETVELLSVTTSTDNALNNNLLYAVYANVPAGDCTADFAGGTPVVGGTISDSEVSHDFGGLVAETTDVHQLCLGVTLDSNEEAVQGEEATVTWQFTATSVE